MVQPRAKQLQVQQHLPLGIFGIQSTAGINVDTQVPDLAGDFEIYDRFVSSTSGGRADVFWQGQLQESQSRIEEVKLAIKGAGASAQYQLKIYAEGSGATPVYDSTLTAAPGSRTVLTVSAGSLSAQPTGEGRYHVLVEAYLDSGETLYVGRPFVKQR